MLLVSVDTETQLHDELLTLRQPGYAFEQQVPFCLLLDVPVDQVRIAAQDIRQQEFIAVPVHVEGLIDGKLVSQLGILAQIHQNFVFDTAGGIGGELDIAAGTEGVDRLDQTDCPDGDQVLDPHPRAFEFAGDVHHQP